MSLPASPVRSRPSVLEWSAIGLLALPVLVIYGWIAANPGSIGFSDSADYLFFADFYLNQFAGNTRFHLLEFYRSTRFPPLYPFVLAVFGGGSETLQRVHIVSFVILVGMLALLWAWIRRETRNPALSLSITALVALSPGLFLLALNPVSEPMAMALTWLAFLLAAHGNPAARPYLVIGLIAGLSTLVRSINIALVLAIPVWLLLQRASIGKWLAGTATAFLPFVAWLGYRRAIPDADSYLDGLKLDYIVKELGGWPELLYVHPWTLIKGFAKNLDHSPDALSISASVVILVLAAIGWWSRARMKTLDAIFTAFYIAIILVWPFPSEAARFMTFLFPVMLLYAGLTLVRITGSASPERGRLAAPLLLASIVALACASSWMHFISLATQELDPELSGEKRTQMYFHTGDRAAGARAAEANVRVRYAAREAVRRIPPGDCVYATLPYLLKLQGPVRAYSYPKRLVDDAPARDQLSLCNYFFIVGVHGIEPTHPPFFPAQALEDWTEPLIVAEYDSNLLLAALLVPTEPDDAGE
jgi:hypothetical protein